jgi:hypothetical protein
MFQRFTLFFRPKHFFAVALGGPAGGKNLLFALLPPLISPLEGGAARLTRTGLARTPIVGYPLLTPDGLHSAG